MTFPGQDTPYPVPYAASADALSLTKQLLATGRSLDTTLELDSGVVLSPPRILLA